MTNTLTSLIPDAYAALDVVSRELVGFIPAVARDPSADRVAVNQSLRIPITPANAAGDNVTPAMALPTAAYQTIGNNSYTISKSRFFPFSWTGPEQKSMDAGPGYLTLKQDQIAQAFRAAIAEMEADIALAAKLGSSRAYGTGAVTPFASTLVDPANMKKILDDNGAPQTDRHLVIDTTAGAKLRTLGQLTKANEAGDTSLLRQGTLLNIHGFDIREAAQIVHHTAGTGAATYAVNGAHAIGATTIAASGGSGTILAGDVITIGTDPNKYVVKTALNAGSLVIQAPGLRIAKNGSETITLSVGYDANMAFSRNAILLGTRLPELPTEGDLAIERETVTDPVSGISFELAVYPGYRMVTVHVLVAWGVAVIKPEHVATLLG